MTRLLEDDPSNRMLAEAVGGVMRELRAEEEDDEGQTFRALMSQRMSDGDNRMTRLETKLDQMQLLIVGAVVAQGGMLLLVRLLA